MAFLEGTIELKLYTDSEQTESPQELIPSYNKVFQNVSVDSAQTTYISLPASGSQTINLNGTSNIQGVALYSSTSDISVNINTLGNITLKAQSPGYMPFVVTSISITNQSSTEATNVLIVLISG